jgi:hypothetical protein
MKTLKTYSQQAKSNSSEFELANSGHAATRGGGTTMRGIHRLALVPLAVACLLVLSACGGSTGSSSSEESGPAVVEEVKGTDLSRITLTQKAAERLDIQTVPVQSEAGKTVIPYSAVLYEADGDTWAYVSLKPLTFIRHRIVVDEITGDRAILSEGPTPGTKVATVGVPELFGAESGLGQ